MRSIFIFTLSLILLQFVSSCGDTVKPQGVVQDLDSLVKLYPDSVPLLVKQGNKFIDAYQYPEALKVGAKAFRLDTNNIDARFLYARCLNNIASRTQADIQNAQNHFKKVLRSEPKNKKAYIELAATYSQQGEFERAFQYINEVLKMDPRYRDAYIMKGSIYRVVGNRKLAISSYETAVQQDPKFYEAYLQLAWMFTEDENYQQAYEYFRNVVELQPKSVDGLYGVAYCKQMLGDYETAIRDYKRLAEIHNDYYFAPFNIGYIKHFEQNQIDSAIYYYQGAIEMEPQCVKCWYYLGLAYKDKKDVTNALKSFSKALEYNPDFEMSKTEANKLR
ncbi:MAG: tetratricopeptide repeat protein [Flavobacteriia bacterium]|jgi:tetratricopeptide (TPR) repeat protein